MTTSVEETPEWLIAIALAGNAWPQHTLKADEAAYEVRQIIAADPEARAALQPNTGEQA